MTHSGKKKTILFVCATGIATSTVVAEKTMDFLHEHGLDANYTQTNVASLPEYDQKDPVIRALPLITGIGADKVLEDIKKHIEE